MILKPLVLAFALAGGIALVPLEASAGVCLTKLTSSAHASLSPHDALVDEIENIVAAYDSPSGSSYYRLQCRDLAALKVGMQATSLTYNVIALGLACTGAGAPVSVGLFAAGTLLYSAEFIVNNLPCEDRSHANIEKQVRLAVCEALESNGIECRP